jgi:tetratricopeptide (TPR) repeat protein
MVRIQEKDGVRQVLVAANAALQAGDVAAADRLILPHLDAGSSDPALLHRAGLVRMHQQRFADAVDLFARARAADPGAAPLAFSHGTALRWLERPAEAVDAFRAAIALQPNYAEAYFEAGTTLQQMGALSEAEKIFRTWLTVLPGHVRGLLALADLLLATGRPQEAETVLRSVFVPPLAAETAGLLHQRLGLALRAKTKTRKRWSTMKSLPR